jgi:hypothetical protein
MPPKSRKALANATNASKRCKKEKIHNKDDSFSISVENDATKLAKLNQNDFDPLKHKHILNLQIQLINLILITYLI